LLKNNGLVKTIKFNKPKYIGDPINAVKIFNEKEADEIIVVDIDATRNKNGPNFRLIEDIVSEAFMPVCYGGGVKNIKEMGNLYYCGVEKVSLSTSAVKKPEIVREASKIFGSQSVVVTIDIQYKFLRKSYQVVIHNGTKKTGIDPVEFAKKMEDFGPGEIVINNVNKDGMMSGYDIEYIKEISNSVKVPIIASGGAGNVADLRDVIVNGGASAVSAGSLFVFHGRHNAVLINYPTQDEIRKLLKV